MATICLEGNGDFSSSKIAKNMKTKLLFIKDKVWHGYIEVQYFSTKKMWYDLINNPKQAASVWLGHCHLQNVPVEYKNEVEQKWTHTLVPPQGWTI